MGGSWFSSDNPGKPLIGLYYGDVTKIYLPELNGKAEFLEQLLRDLTQFRLVKGMTISFAQQAFPQQFMTNHGIRFLDFVLDPEESRR